MPTVAPGRRDGRPGRVRALATAVALLALAAWTWSIGRSVERLERSEARFHALEDSLRSRGPYDRQLDAVERRIARVERDVAATGRPARTSELIALRRWVRRLEGEVLANRRRIERIGGSFDSLWASGGAADSVLPGTSPGEAWEPMRPSPLPQP